MSPFFYGYFIVTPFLINTLSDSVPQGGLMQNQLRSG